MISTYSRCTKYLRLIYQSFICQSPFEGNANIITWLFLLWSSITYRESLTKRQRMWRRWRRGLQTRSCWTYTAFINRHSLEMLTLVSLAADKQNYFHAMFPEFWPVPRLCLCYIVDIPGMTDLKGKAKWDAWESRKGNKFKMLVGEKCKDKTCYLVSAVTALKLTTQTFL